MDDSADLKEVVTGAWWLAPKKDKADPTGKAVAQAITMVATNRETAMMPRRYMSYCFHRMMTGRPNAAQFAYGLARRPDSFIGYYGSAEWAPMRSGFAASLGDVYVNRLFSHPTLIDFEPDFGDEDQRQLSEDLTTWSEEIFTKTDFWTAYDDAGLNSIYYGTGWLKFTGTKKRFKVESVNPDELLFATEDNPRPTETIQRVWTTKTAAMGTYGKKNAAVREAIRNAQTAYPAFYFDGILNTENVISILESWICPNPDDPDDKGRHCLVIGDYTVIDEDWEAPALPFERFAFHELPSSTYGQGLAEILFQINEWIDDLLQVMQESDIRSGTAKWLTEENSNVNPDALGDTNAAVVTYLGVKPELITPDPINQYALQRFNMLVDMGMRRAHVSLNAVQGEIPKGLESAVAIERYAQIDDANFAHAIGRLEVLVRNSILQLLRLAKRFKPKYTMPGRDQQIVDWNDVEVDGDQPLKINPLNVGRLGQTVAGRVQQLEKMAAAGDISRQVYNRYLQIPNLDGRGGMLDEINAPTEGVAKILTKMVKKGGKYIPPSPFLDLDYAKQAVEARIILEQGWGTSEALIDRLRMWRAAVVELIAQRDNPQQPANDNGAADAAAGAPDAAQAPTTGIQLPDTAPGAPVGPEANVPGKPIPTDNAA